MRRKYQLMMKYVILGSALIGLITAQFVLLYAFERRERRTTSVFYTDPITSEPISYEIDFKICTPTSYTGKLPTVIMLHGDLVDDKSMNFIKTEFIQKGYLVALMKLDFTYQSYFEIEAVMNYLLIQPNVEDAQIGIIGHSHGSHFAFWFAKMHDDVIQGTIMENMGTVGQLYDDYYDYYNYFVETSQHLTHLDYVTNFTDSITVDNPKNLLIITDNYQPVRATEISEVIIATWQFDEPNVMTGSFNNGTARELNTQYRMFFHGSGLYNPLVIQKDLYWMSSALGHPMDENSVIPISIRVYSYFVLLLGVIVLSSFFLIKGLNLIPIQLSWLKNRLYSRRKEKTQDVTIEIPKVLEWKSKEIPNKDLFRLNRRYSREFDIIYDTAEYFRVLIIIAIGTHLFLYLLQLMAGENSLYYVGPSEFGDFLNVIFAFNDNLNEVLFTHPLSFSVMYFWILIVFFIRRLRIKDPRMSKARMNFLDAPNILILAVEIFALFFLFGWITLYHWLGLNFFQSGINILLRFAILFYLHFTVIETGFSQTTKPESLDREIYTRTTLMALLMYIPLLIPSISILLRAYNYAPYYIIPYLTVVGLVVGFSVFGKKSAFQITLPVFFILLFWKYNMYYWILF
ncbi:MAG: hypothetical protein EU530_01710 [Promethearchaeota archaeon]|nr:MAG: hypothetical protein EU530_01710 [Candidatus Lokiarchaeota archaeon]